MSIEFPVIDPVIFSIGPLSIRWYALAYVAGLFLGYQYCLFLLRKFVPKNVNFTPKVIEDLFSHVALGVIIGGRLGYVFFYKPMSYLNDPISILKVWEGGMSFHGGLVGVILAIIIFGRVVKISPIEMGDYVAPAVPIGLFFGRIANFINAELYGRVTDVAWAVQFPDSYYYGQFLHPRHPSQIYEALTEGLFLFLIMVFLIFYKDILQYRGRSVGTFLVGYSIARIFCEFFREPDDFLGFVFQTGGVGLTQGMILSLPMLLLGMFFIFRKNQDNAASL